MSERCDIAIIGAGAAGLMASIWAGRTAQRLASPRTSAGRAIRILALDGARTLGAKILVAGGGRCNVTHDAVDESAYAGSTPPAIRNVLRRFGVPETLEFFRELGVELKREETGKLFPTTDRARTVLDALLVAAHDAGVEIRHPWRVGSIRREGDAFVIDRASSEAAGSSPLPAGEFQDPDPTPDRVLANRVIVATGGMSLPKTGSDGGGYALVRSLGHTLTPRVFPSLVPLLLPKGHALTTLSGLSAHATLEVRAASGKRLASFTDAVLCTHFGISGPAALDVSRHYLDAVASGGGSVPPTLHVNWTPGLTTESADAALVEATRAHSSWTCVRAIASLTPGPPMAERLARTLVELAGLDPAMPIHALAKGPRRELASTLTQLTLPIVGDRGFGYAEVTAGGVPLAQLHLKTLESRACSGLHLCGEICDVDGRIGGYNFQWAWSSGFVAGVSASEAILGQPAP